jgi:chromosome segregation ATPase
MRNPLDVLRARLDGAIERRVEASVGRHVGASAATLDEAAGRRTDELRARADAAFAAAEVKAADRFAAIAAQIEQIEVALGELGERIERVDARHDGLREELDSGAAAAELAEVRDETASGIERIREGLSAISVALVDQQRAHGELLEQVVARVIGLEELARTAGADPAPTAQTSTSAGRG